MAENKTPRSTLKGYFKAGEIPLEENFSDLIDSGFNQNDDGIQKSATDPLKIQAAQGNPDQDVLRLYGDINAPPKWIVNLQPMKDDGKSHIAGLNIGDGSGKSRFFISQATGDVGLGTTTPASKLHLISEKNGLGVYIQSASAGNTHLPYANNWNYISGKGVIFRDESHVERIKFDHAGSGNAPKITVNSGDNGQGVVIISKTAGNTHLPYVDNWNYISGKGVIFRDQSSVERIRFDHAGSGNAPKINVVPSSNGQGIVIVSPSAGSTHLPYTDNWNYIAGKGVIFRNEANVEKIRFDLETGNVGIGTNQASSKLTILDNVPTAVTIKTSDNTKSVGIAFRNSGDGFTWNIFRADAGGNYADLIFSGGNNSAKIEDLTERLRISKAGNIGIGKTAPTAKLHIVPANNGQGIFVESATAGNTFLPSTDNWNYISGKGVIFRDQNNVERIRFNHNASGTSSRIQVVPVNDGQGIAILSETAGNTHLPYTNNWNYIAGKGVIFRNEANQEKIRFDHTIGTIKGANTRPLTEQMVHRRIIYGYAGDARLSFTNTLTTVRNTIYGPFGYAIPAVQAGATRKYRLYAIYSDTMTSAGVVAVNFVASGGQTVQFQLGLTWGGAGDKNRDGFSNWQPASALSAFGTQHGVVHIFASVSDKSGVLHYLELQSWDFF